MLEVTDAAVQALLSIRGTGPYEDDAGVRIRLVEEEGERGIGLTFEEPPREGDEKVAEASGLDVFVASELVGPLGTAVLDVRETEQGRELTLRERAHEHDAGHEGHDHG